MKVNEIFYSLQGEGLWAGLPNVFVRTTGCNLRCSYCDTKFAYFEGEELKIEDIIEKIKKYQSKHVCITGGEPLIQDDIYDLIDKLIKNNYSVSLETNGSMEILKLSSIDKILISLDLKCPSSNMQDRNNYNNIDYLRKNDQLKFIIKDKKDYVYAKRIIKDYKPDCNIIFQPVWETDPKKLANWIVSDKLKVRFGLQLHKIVWGDQRKK
jgi:7-carboxy-7-deazaguanine synthase